MWRTSEISILLGSATLVAVLTFGSAPARALHCPAAPGSLTWGACITEEDEPGGQTVREASVEITPNLECAGVETALERSGPRDWCQRYTLTVTNDCDGPLEFQRPVLGAANRRILTSGESADIIGLEACVESSRSRRADATSSAPDASDAAEDTDGENAADTTSGPTDTGGGLDADGTSADADAGRDAADSMSDGMDGGGSLDEVCAAFGDDISSAGDHSATYEFEHGGQNYELTQSVTTIAFETWYEEECGDEPERRDTGTPGGAGDSGQANADVSGSCGCGASRPVAPLAGDILVLAILLVAVRMRRKT